jgi:hypothetical protein
MPPFEAANIIDAIADHVDQQQVVESEFPFHLTTTSCERFDCEARRERSYRKMPSSLFVDIGDGCEASISTSRAR